MPVIVLLQQQLHRLTLILEVSISTRVPTESALIFVPDRASIRENESTDQLADSAVTEEGQAID